MPRAGKRKLKVFQASFGFFDSVVAVPSQAAALRAWGTHQDLFKSGHARIATAPDAIEAALAHPEVPLRRAIGSTDRFSLAPDLPTLPNPPAPHPSAKAVRKARPKPVPPPVAAPDRTALAEAEAALAQIESRGQVEAAAVRAERHALDVREAKALQHSADAASVARKRVEAARVAFTRAGGRP